ncbi:MAG: plasmid recombination protein [Desulfobulbaceae bacterium]|nr:plasmid recombination protein [Desulfobulbaceae bacterium]
MTTAALAILRVEKMKTMGQVASAAGHHNRTRPTINANPVRQNELIIGSGDPHEDLRRRLDDSGVRVGKNNVLAYDVLLSASPEFFRPGRAGAAGQWLKQRAEAFKRQSVKWLCDCFGKNNVVSAIYHLDESTPHITALVTPIDDSPRAKGPKVRLNARRWTGGRGKLAKMQTSFAQALAPLGISRGLEKSQATHTDIKDFYKLIYGGQKLKITMPVVPKPPLTGRAEWAQKETNRIQTQLKKETDALVKAAATAQLLAKQKEDIEATAVAQARDLQKIRKQVRDIPLPLVAEALALEPDQYDKNKWNGQSMAITIQGSKFYDHRQNRGGGGAIDLTMHAMECDCQQATSWLADRFGDSQAAGAVTANAARVVKEAKKDRRPFSQPAPAPDAWPAAREYLLSRGLDPSLIDEHHHNGTVYASQRGRYTNVVWLNRADNPDCAEIRGVGGDYKGLSPGSQRDAGGFRLKRGPEKILVLVEAAADAVAYAQLHPSFAGTIMSTAGVRSDAPFIRDARQNGLEVICGYDADGAGDDAAVKMIEKYPEITRERPTPPLGKKDWNDQLKAQQARVQQDQKHNITTSSSPKSPRP